MARKMKDSGIEWIGEIPEGWEVAKLKNIVSIVRGGSPRPIEAYMSDNDNDVNWIRISDTEKGSKYITHTSRKLIASGISKSRFIKRGSLILTNSMSFGEPYILDIDGCIHDGWVAFSDFKKINKEFLYYFLTSPLAKIQFEQQVDGGVVKNLNIDKIGDTVILLPSLIDQNKIIAHLDSLTSETNSLLSKTITSIEDYKKLKHAVITQAVTKGVRGEREMKDSGVEWIGMVPKEWALLPFRRVLKERNEKNTPIKSTERLSLSIELGVTLYSEKTTNLDRFKDDFEQYKLAYKGDLVMNSMNMIVGATGVSEYFGCVSPVYYTFYDDSLEHVTAKYCEYIFRSKTMLRVLYSLGKGIYAIVRGDDRVNTCRLKVSKDDLKSLIVPVPSLNEQREIVHYLNAKCAEIDKLISKKEQLVKELESYKKSLIYEVVTGKREV